MTRMQAYKVLELIDWVGDNIETLVPAFEVRMRIIDLMNVLKVDMTYNLRKGEYEDLPGMDSLQTLRRRNSGRKTDGAGKAT